MKLKDVMRIVVIAMGLGLGSVLFVHTSSASAVSGACFFKTTAGPVTGTSGCSAPGIGDYGTNDVLTGRSTNGNGSAIPSSVNTKSEFVSFIKGRFSDGAHDKVGAAFIMQELRGKNTWPSSSDVTDWVNLMNQSNVSVSRGTDSSVGRTSYYDPSNKNTFYARHPSVSRTVIYIKQSGRVIAEVEVGCGNMVAESTNIKPPNWNLSSTSSVPTPKHPGDSVTFSHAVTNDGPEDMTKDLKVHVEWDSTAPGITKFATVGSKCDVSGGLNDGSSKSCNKTVTIPVSAKNGDQYCQKIYYFPDRPSSTSETGGTRACVTIHKPVALECSAVGAVSPSGSPSEGENVVLSFGATQNADPNIGGWRLVNPFNTKVTYTVLRPDGSTLVGPVASPTYNASLVYPNLYTIAAAVGGIYTVKWSVTAGSGIDAGSKAGCVATVPVASKPYLKVYGGDVASGASFMSGTTCGAPTGAGNLRAFNKAAPSYQGSGTQVAVFARGAIEQFVSSDLRTPTIPTGLTFANTAGAYGGTSGFTPCIPDYWSISAPKITAPVPAYILDNNPAKFAGKNPQALPANYHKDIFILGNVHITTNIVYDPSASWTSVEMIPSHRLIVKGNIYIDDSVTRLDGIYIALPNGAVGGNIYTCTSVATVPSMGDIYNACRTNILTVNGAFIAKQVKLTRLKNSLSNSIPNEQNNTSQAAEIFNYTPEAWMAKPEFPMTKNQSYDLITSLPAVL